MQRPTVDSGGELTIGLRSLPSCLLGHHENESVQARVVALDALQTVANRRRPR